MLPLLRIRVGHYFSDCTVSIQLKYTRKIYETANYQKCKTHIFLFIPTTSLVLYELLKPCTINIGNDDFVFMFFNFFFFTVFLHALKRNEH